MRTEPTGLPPILADHVALDLLNTVTQDEGRLTDHLVSDAAAAQWLSRALGSPVTSARGLAAHAVQLREAVRGAVMARKSGSDDVEPLNSLAGHMGSHPVLVRHGEGLRVQRAYAGDAAWQALAPIGEAAMALLAEGDFDLVRQCEHDDCVLWFYDRTRSHRRRWCSMAVCGNRHKVSRFRQRNAG
jgi:predicted RNA-binding Zn ribbon-like protein